MAFVTCKQFNRSQEGQDEKISAIEQALQDKNSRLQDDLTERLKTLNDKLNQLKEVEVALNVAKTEGNYHKIKALEQQLQAAKEAQSAGDKGLAEAIEALRQQGLSDADIQKIIADAIAKAGGRGRYITQIIPNQNDGTVTYYYSDGSTSSGKLANFTAVADQKTIVGNGGEQALRVQLSQQAGNMLEVRDDGIYYGQTAKADLANLYVSNNGDDNNIGTRDKPLRTIQEAMNRIENVPAWHHIWLHEGHQFDWVYADKSFARLIFDVYGPLVDQRFPMSVPKNAYYRGYTAKNFPRPTINVRVNQRDNFIMRQQLICQETTFRGIRVEIHNKFEGYDDGSLSGNFAGIINANDAITFHGSILNENTKGVAVGDGAGVYRSDIVFRSPIIRWIDSLAENMPDLVSSNYTSQFSLISWNFDRLAGYGEAPDHEALIKSATAFQDMSRGMRQRIHNVVFDDSTKSIFGMVLNWDIFAHS